MLNCEVHLCCYNEAEILPYTLRHYGTFCSRIVIHDNFSTDGSREIAKAAGAEVVDWGTAGVIDETKLCEVKNEAWRGTDADWVIVGDADEFVYFPGGAEDTLAIYDANKETVIKPHGFEMLADEYPSGDGQIYEYVTMGAPDVQWYSKPALFSPKRVKTISYGFGAHGCTATLHNGGVVANPVKFTEPPTYFLHFKHLGGPQRLAARYDSAFKRQTALAHKMHWGNQEPGLKHALDKRTMILAGLRQVIS